MPFHGFRRGGWKDADAFRKPAHSQDTKSRCQAAFCAYPPLVTKQSAGRPLSRSGQSADWPARGRLLRNRPALTGAERRISLWAQVNTHKEVQCETGGPVRLNHAEKVHGLFPRDSFLLCKLTVRYIVCHYLPTMFLNNPTYILPIFIIEFLYPQGLVHLRINQKL